MEDSWTVAQTAAAFQQAFGDNVTDACLEMEDSMMFQIMKSMWLFAHQTYPIMTSTLSPSDLPERIRKDLMEDFAWGSHYDTFQKLILGKRLWRPYLHSLVNIGSASSLMQHFCTIVEPNRSSMKTITPFISENEEAVLTTLDAILLFGNFRLMQVQEQSPLLIVSKILSILQDKSKHPLHKKMYTDMGSLEDVVLLDKAYVLSKIKELGKTYSWMKDVYLRLHNYIRNKVSSSSRVSDDAIKFMRETDLVRFDTIYNDDVERLSTNKWNDDSTRTHCFVKLDDKMKNDYNRAPIGDADLIVAAIAKATKQNPNSVKVEVSFDRNLNFGEYVQVDQTKWVVARETERVFSDSLLDFDEKELTRLQEVLKKEWPVDKYVIYYIEQQEYDDLTKDNLSEQFPESLRHLLTKRDADHPTSSCKLGTIYYLDRPELEDSDGRYCKIVPMFDQELAETIIPFAKHLMASQLTWFGTSFLNLIATWSYLRALSPPSPVSSQPKFDLSSNQQEGNDATPANSTEDTPSSPEPVSSSKSSLFPNLLKVGNRFIACAKQRPVTTLVAVLVGCAELDVLADELSVAEYGTKEYFESSTIFKDQTCSIMANRVLSDTRFRKQFDSDTLLEVERLVSLSCDATGVSSPIIALTQRLKGLAQLEKYEDRFPRDTGTISFNTGLNGWKKLGIKAGTFAGTLAGQLSESLAAKDEARASFATVEDSFVGHDANAHLVSLKNAYSQDQGSFTQRVKKFHEDVNELHKMLIRSGVGKVETQKVLNDFQVYVMGHINDDSKSFASEVQKDLINILSRVNWSEAKLLEAEVDAEKIGLHPDVTDAFTRAVQQTSGHLVVEVDYLEYVRARHIGKVESLLRAPDDFRIGHDRVAAGTSASGGQLQANIKYRFEKDGNYFVLLPADVPTLVQVWSNGHGTAHQVAFARTMRVFYDVRPKSWLGRGIGKVGGFLSSVFNSVGDVAWMDSVLNSCIPNYVWGAFAIGTGKTLKNIFQIAMVRQFVQTGAAVAASTLIGAAFESLQTNLLEETQAVGYARGLTAAFLPNGTVAMFSCYNESKFGKVESIGLDPATAIVPFKPQPIPPRSVYGQYYWMVLGAAFGVTRYAELRPDKLLRVLAAQDRLDFTLTLKRLQFVEDDPMLKCNESGVVTLEPDESRGEDLSQIDALYDRKTGARVCKSFSLRGKQSSLNGRRSNFNKRFVSVGDRRGTTERTRRTPLRERVKDYTKQRRNAYLVEASNRRKQQANNRRDELTVGDMLALSTYIRSGITVNETTILGDMDYATMFRNALLHDSVDRELRTEDRNFVVDFATIHEAIIMNVTRVHDADEHNFIWSALKNNAISAKNTFRNEIEELMAKYEDPVLQRRALSTLLLEHRDVVSSSIQSGDTIGETLTSIVQDTSFSELSYTELARQDNALVSWTTSYTRNSSSDLSQLRDELVSEIKSVCADENVEEMLQTKASYNPRNILESAFQLIATLLDQNNQILSDNGVTQREIDLIRTAKNYIDDLSDASSRLDRSTSIKTMRDCLVGLINKRPSKPRSRHQSVNSFKMDLNPATRNFFVDSTPTAEQVIRLITALFEDNFFEISISNGFLLLVYELYSLCIRKTDENEASNTIVARLGRKTINAAKAFGGITGGLLTYAARRVAEPILRFLCRGMRVVVQSIFFDGILKIFEFAGELTPISAMNQVSSVVARGVYNACGYVAALVWRLAAAVLYLPIEVVNTVAEMIKVGTVAVVLPIELIAGLLERVFQVVQVANPVNWVPRAYQDTTAKVLSLLSGIVVEHASSIVSAVLLQAGAAAGLPSAFVHLLGPEYARPLVGGVVAFCGYWVGCFTFSAAQMAGQKIYHYLRPFQETTSLATTTNQKAITVGLIGLGLAIGAATVAGSIAIPTCVGTVSVPTFCAYVPSAVTFLQLMKEFLTGTAQGTEVISMILPLPAVEASFRACGKLWTVVDNWRQREKLEVSDPAVQRRISRNAMSQVPLTMAYDVQAEVDRQVGQILRSVIQNTSHTQGEIPQRQYLFAQPQMGGPASSALVPFAAGAAQSAGLHVAEALEQYAANQAAVVQGGARALGALATTFPGEAAGRLAGQFAARAIR